MKLIIRSFFALIGTSTALSAATFFTEDFSGETSGENLTLGTGFGTPTTSFAGGNFMITSGAGSRIYLGTKDADYSTVSFIFEATVSVPNSTNAWSIAFLGMGNPDADGANFGEPLIGSNLFMNLRPDLNNLGSRDNQTAITGAIQDTSPVPVANATHRLRMIWNAGTKVARFEYDAGNDGTVDKSFTLDGTDNNFTALNSKLVLGGGNGLRFTNVTVRKVPEPATYGLIGAGALAGVAVVTVGVFVIRRRRLAPIPVSAPLPPPPQSE